MDLAHLYNEYSSSTQVFVRFDTPKADFHGTIRELLRKIDEYYEKYSFCSYYMLEVEEYNEHE